MPDIRLVLTGQPYSEPRYYGQIAWTPRDVYARHPGGGKDSRHSDGQVWFTTTGPERARETRIPTSDVTSELVTFITLRSDTSEPPRLKGPPRSTDLLIPTTSAGRAPRVAVEIVAAARVAGVVAAWERVSGVSSVLTVIDKGLGQSLVLAFATNVTTSPSTSAV